MCTADPAPILGGVAWLPAILAVAALGSAPPVTIAVVDTGANVRVPAIAAKRPATYDIRTRGRDVRDMNGHGTVVASLVARASGNARLLIVRAGSSSGAFSDVNEAAAIRYAIGRGALLVAAAGDDYADRPEYPAALLGPSGLAVAAVTGTGIRAPFSNTGPWVSVAALGERGTSFAAPLVAGAAARVWSANPRLTARQVVALLERTASGRGTRTDDLGYGVIDVAAALALARATP